MSKALRAFGAAAEEAGAGITTRIRAAAGPLAMTMLLGSYDLTESQLAVALKSFSKTRAHQLSAPNLV